MASDKCQPSSAVYNMFQNFLADSREEMTSKEAFVERLATFSLFKWSAKPPAISPLQCARYGWSNNDVDVLKCISCGAILCGQLPKRFQIESYRNRCKQVTEQLVESHHKLCPWRNNAISESYYRIDRWTKEEICSEFLNRVQSLLRVVADCAPTIEDNDEATIKESLQQLQKLATDGETFALPAVQLALRGWICNKETIPSCPIINCLHCVRSVGLWNYVTEKSDESSDNNDKRAAKKKKLELFNPVTEHHSWCPWVVEDSNIPGWKLFYKALLNRTTKCEQNGIIEPSKEHLHQIRKWLNV